MLIAALLCPPPAHLQGAAAAVGNLQDAVPDQAAALAAGWVPGRGRDIFKLLRFHVKKNRAQVKPVACCLLLSAFDSLPVACGRHLLPAAYCLLPAACCLWLTTCCL